MMALYNSSRTWLKEMYYKQLVLSLRKLFTVRIAHSDGDGGRNNRYVFTEFTLTRACCIKMASKKAFGISHNTAMMDFIYSAVVYPYLTVAIGAVVFYMLMISTFRLHIRYRLESLIILALYLMFSYLLSIHNYEKYAKRVLGIARKLEQGTHNFELILHISADKQPRFTLVKTASDGDWVHTIPVEDDYTDAIWRAIIEYEDSKDIRKKDKMSELNQRYWHAAVARGVIFLVFSVAAIVGLVVSIG